MDPAKAKKFASAVPDAYRRTDEEIGKILAKATGKPYVVVVSDHGFQSSSDPSKAIGTHNPDGIYIVSGPGITPKSGLPKFIEDVTPTVLYLLGLPTGQDMDGKVFAEVGEMIGRAPTSIPSYEKGGRDSTDEPVDGDTWESLKGLGYVDGAPPRAADKNKAAPDKNAAGRKDPGMPPAREAPVPRPPVRTPPGAAAPAAKAPAAPAEGNALENWPEAPHE